MGRYELNPIGRYLFEQSEWASWAFKLGLTMIIAGGLVMYTRKDPFSAKIMLITLIILLTAICLYNGINLISTL